MYGATPLPGDAHSVIGRDTYEHAEDRTFEVRLTGPALVFETLGDRLMARGDIVSVHGG